MVGTGKDKPPAVGGPSRATWVERAVWPVGCCDGVLPASLRPEKARTVSPASAPGGSQVQYSVCRRASRAQPLYVFLVFGFLSFLSLLLPPLIATLFT